MASDLDRAYAILDALNDGPVAPEDANSAIEEVINRVGSGASPENNAGAFIRILAKQIRRLARSNGEKRKRQDISDQIGQAGQAAEDKIPAGVPKNDSGKKNT